MRDCKLAIKVVPNASRTEVVGWLGDALKIRVQAAPEDGKANKALVKFLSRKLCIEQKHIILESGEFSPQKRLRLEGLERSELFTLLEIQDHHG
ncbi:MAG: DUF167 domain-containing protein [Verrucomicrobia bacterium]|nr:DUF167 domain-containing protein [Verrucomicrobiota bacterium]